MGKVAGWCDLPEELINVIANRSSSNIDLLRIRSICKPWRAAVAAKKRSMSRFKRTLLHFECQKYFLSPTTFFRVTLPSSCPRKGWLMKTEEVFESKSKPESGKVKLSFPLSRRLTTSSVKTLDLLKFGVSEIRQSCNVQCFYDLSKHSYMNDCSGKVVRYSGKVVLVDNLVFAINNEKELFWCKSGEESSNTWTTIKNEEVEYFLDITLHKGQIYALDLKGAVWWFSLLDLSIFQYGISTPLDVYDIDTCKDKRLVEYCGDLCVVHRFCKNIRVKRVDVEKTIGFKVYKMDEGLVSWVEVNSLGDKALIVATNSCFTVSASDYYGCLENAIYFTDGENVSLLKLDDGSIITNKMINPFSSHQSCFQMFYAPFL